MPGVLTRKTRTARGKLASSSTPASVTITKKVSKLQASGKESLQTAAPLTLRSSNIEIILPSRKRKVHDDAAPTAKKLRRESDAQPVAPATPVSRKKKSVRFAEPETAPSTPSRAEPTPPPSRKRQFESDETSHAEALLERLNLQSPVNKRKKTTVHRRAPQDNFDLPKELLDLLDLYAAFTSTLSLQYTHNGTTSPIDLRTLYSSVTRAWGKRHVSLEDIQRCVGVLAWTPVKNDKAAPKTPLFLCDYGHGMICIELQRDVEPGPSLQHKLNMDFEANLRTLWLSSCDQPATIFIATLPKAAIKPCPLMAKGLLSRNQTTLDNFKKDIALKKQQEQAAKATQPPALQNNGTTTTTITKLSLLDRIRLKEQVLSSLPAGPTPAELQRRAALQRAADVAAVISMLCKATVATGTGQTRMSFTMAALLVRLRDSMRTPVSHEDGAICVRLLAAEIAPRWLRVVKIGGRETVVCEVGGQPTKGEVEERVQVLLG
ncbi:hypothetical protein C8A00DRAFT_45364 [Chaetomidium leptoderma]|uniref:DNA replication factor Cdt1 C-terminal domain-containing protein n=1 Tax=Chaetomidium leptoderma TaxID=669021 RepID=A0AAN6VIF7_9PEZI|nr:hypothetical protein C8A00DRAFT_45364 [Chaetomidium leptoderma]